MGGGGAETLSIIHNIFLMIPKKMYLILLYLFKIFLMKSEFLNNSKNSGEGGGR